MSAASYWMGTAVVALGAALGIIEWQYVGHFILIFMINSTGVYIFFRSGLNLRFTQPNFTTTQIVLSMLPGLYVMYHVASPQARAALLLIAIVPMLYGILDLTRRRFLGVTLCYFVAYCGMFALLAWHGPSRLAAPGEWIVILAMAMLMVQTGLIGGDGASIVANRLRARIEQLEFLNERNEPFKVTISMGIAEGTRANNSVLWRADEALYRAKHAGRKRVRMAEA